MPKGIPKAGYRRTRKLSEEPSIQAIEAQLVRRSPDFLMKLEELTKPMTCPGCGTQVRGPDRDAIIYLCNRALGMPKQRQEVGIEVSVSADVADRIIERLCNEDERFRIAYESYLALPEPKGE